jgi:hypothetical protein
MNTPVTLARHSRIGCGSREMRCVSHSQARSTRPLRLLGEHRLFATSSRALVARLPFGLNGPTRGRLSVSISACGHKQAEGSLRWRHLLRAQVQLQPHASARS